MKTNIKIAYAERKGLREIKDSDPTHRYHEQIRWLINWQQQDKENENPQRPSSKNALLKKNP